MNLSVVIPAYNSAETIAQTIASLQAQTLPDWEAIVVNDGSTDKTAKIVNQFAQQDARIQVIHQPQRGVSTARNEGIRLAQFDWLLFLDADDWIAPDYIEKMFGKLASQPDLDVVHCSSVRVASDGTCYGEKTAPLGTDLFAELARYCPFSINACIVRKALVQSLGGFDPFFYNNQDWDLWQRIARTGARFGAVSEVLAFYRMRHNSHSSDGTKRFTYGLRTLAQGHSPDPRVANPHPAHAYGMPSKQLPELKLLLATWCAGTLLGRGTDACHLLALLEDEPLPDLDLLSIALCLLESLPVPTTQSPSILWKRWSELEPGVNAFLAAMEAKVGVPLLKRRVRVILDRLILQHAETPFPLALGDTYAMRVEVTEPLVDQPLPATIERVYCVIELAGSLLGALELPACDGVLSGVVLADAIAAHFAWKILGHFFEHTIYTNLTTADNFQTFHDERGWQIFLQQLWHRPDWSNADFYNPDIIDSSTLEKYIEHPEITIEVSEDIPNVYVNASELNVLLTVGGAALGYIAVQVNEGWISAQALRVALLLNTGSELCCAVVREGLLGRSLTEAGNLRQRLSAAAQRRQASAVKCHWEIGNDSLDSAMPLLVLGRRSGAIGTSDSRWARFPVAVAPTLLEAAIATHEPIVQSPDRGRMPHLALYAPDRVVLAVPSQLAPGVSRSQAQSIGVSDSPPPEQAVVDQPSWLTRWWKPAKSKAQSQPFKPRDTKNQSGNQHPHQRVHSDINTSETIVTKQLAILNYQPVDASESRQKPRWQVTPQAFAEQLRYLQEVGYYSINLATWQQAIVTRQPLPGRAILLTFDDDSLAFYTDVFPLLEKYGFSATVFLAADRDELSPCQSGSDRPALPPMTWAQIRQLQAAGIEFGSRACHNLPLTGLSVAEIAQQGLRSRAILSQQLGKPIRSFAYPYGAVDPVVQHLIGACGYTVALTTCPERSHFQNSLLALPRIPVEGTDTLADFVAKLG